MRKHELLSEMWGQVESHPDIDENDTADAGGDVSKPGKRGKPKKKKKPRRGKQDDTDGMNLKPGPRPRSLASFGGPNDIDILKVSLQITIPDTAML